MVLDGLTAAGTFPAAEEAARIESGGKERLGWHDDIDALTEGIWINVDVDICSAEGDRSDKGVVLGVALGDGVEDVVVRPIVVFGFVSYGFVIRVVGEGGGMRADGGRRGVREVGVGVGEGNGLRGGGWFAGPVSAEGEGGVRACARPAGGVVVGCL